MRHPRARKPTTTSPLHTLIAALPDEALRPLLIELLQTGASSGMPAAAPAEDPESAPPARRAYKRRAGSRPPGRRRGRPRKVDSADPKLVARRERAKLKAREKRAAAKAAAASTSNGNGSPKSEITPAQLWEHAARISPKTPWRAVARELGANEAQALDAYRSGSLPPGITANAIERFLELPAP